MNVANKVQWGVYPEACQSSATLGVNRPQSGVHLVMVMGITGALTETAWISPPLVKGFVALNCCSLMQRSDAAEHPSPMSRRSNIAI